MKNNNTKTDHVSELTKILKEGDEVFINYLVAAELLAKKGEGPLEPLWKKNKKTRR